MTLSSVEKKQTNSKVNPLIALLNLQTETMWREEGEDKEEDKRMKITEEVIELDG